MSRISVKPGVPTGLAGCGAANVSRWATFNWATAAGASSYVIEIAADAPNADNVVERRTATVTSTTHSIPDNDPLSASREIYWRVRAQNSGGAGPWSAWCGFTTEAAVAPTGLSPRNQANVSRTPTFTWNAARGAQSYNFRIAADAPSEANIVDRRSASETSASHSTPGNDPLSPNRNFYWQVQTVDRTETGPWSAWAHFSTTNDLPDKVAGLSGCGAVNVSRWPTVSWAAAEGASSYVVEFAADAPSEANVVARRTATVDGISHTIPDNDPLSASRDVYWRVRGQNVVGAGPWSDWCGFTTGAAVAPGGLSPNNQANVSRTPTFTWNAARGAQSYNFRIAADSPSEANVIERRSTNTISATHTIPGNDQLSPSRTFYWQVQTVDRTETGPWSSWAQFETVNDLPAQVTGLAGCGAINVSRWAAFNWGAVAGASSYVIEIAADAPNADNVVERRTATVTATTHSIPDNDPLSASREIYWRVRAQNSAGAGPWSAWCGFTTEVAAAPSGLSPRNQSNVSRTPTFIWNPARGALSYNFRIAADAPSVANVVERRSTNTISATHTILSNDRLSPSRTFYWQVQTVDRTETGPWSSWAQFSTGP